MADVVCPSGVHHDGVCCHRCDHGYPVGCSCIDVPVLRLDGPRIEWVGPEPAPIALTEDGRVLHPCVDCGRVVCFVPDIQCTLCVLIGDKH